MTAPGGEMPFLEHLEELRLRIIRSLGAVVVGVVVGYWLVQRFQLVVLLKQPIAPYLPDGKLAVLSPTEPLMIVLKLAFVVGLVLASPVIIYQAWAFLAPALYQQEKRAVLPALVAGTVLFLVGAALGFLVVVPQALRVLFSFQSEALQNVITYDAYFGFVLQIVLALGISFELPLVIILLAWLGVVTPAGLHRFRRMAVVLAFAGGAVLSPGTDVVSMLMLTVPLLLLYEIGVLGTAVIHRRRARRAAATIVSVLACWALATPAQAQQDTARADTTLRRTPAGAAIAPDLTPADEAITGDTARTAGATPRGGQALDTATARRLGLPTAPRREFPRPDTVLAALLRRPGYQATRYLADSATLLADERRILLAGSDSAPAMTERKDATLEAETITYAEGSCVLDAAGDPHLFDRTSVLVGEGIRYNTCTRRGVVTDALTNFQEGGVAWFLRGDVAQDSSSSRIYAASSEITSCDLPVPHYHFAARQVKWVSRTVIVARSAVLYVRDVPILWLPFIFQDTRPGRRSGILVPQFGINDIVRPSGGYNRQVTNIGYYWAPNDYMDLTARLDWYSRRYVQYGVSGQYRWLDRFLNGAVAYDRTIEREGSSATALRWSHQQNFNLTTSLRFDVNYASNSSVVRRNAIDPILTTQQITSSLNFSKRYGWGTLTIGGNRRQSLTDNSVTQQLPAVTLSPRPIDLSRSVTWSPALSLTHDRASNQPAGRALVANANGLVDTVDLTADTRTTAFNFDTPLRIGGFNWRNTLNLTDRERTGRDSVTFFVPDPARPGDSLRVVRLFDADFSTGLNWETGINLPTLFRGSWKLQPVVGVANVVSGQPFALRNRNTQGDWVVQGKRFSFALNATPTFFGFFPGIFGLSRIRHSVSPIISYNYSPAASIPEEFARAITRPGQPLVLRSDPTQTMSIGLAQNFEGKRRTAEGDTTAADRNAPKVRLLSISTSAVAFDFEQARKPGRTGWRTQTVSNAFQSDLLPGFSLSLTHDLWRGTVGTDTARFDPFLTSVSASFAVSEATLRPFARLLGLGGRDDRGRRRQDAPSTLRDRRGIPRIGSFYSSSQLSTTGGRGFNANFDYTLSRSRPTPGPAAPREAQQSLALSTSFSPTPFWALSWSTQYNITRSRFESHIVRLERDLHEWKASFNFVKNVNGNFAFYFTIFLTHLPDVKFDYDQTTVER
ncbi:MAG TPA: twin-arginine translocase subunit TatC [Gemmatimonadales bacterium]|nr:twin-arginine translocase subunit TatC [Gemmatimonadales bacterium]